MSVKRNENPERDNTLDVLAATLYAEARGEPDEGKIWVLWVIRNRARMNKKYWGGSKIKDVCLHPYQFECWNKRDEIVINDLSAFKKCQAIVEQVMNSNEDPTDGCDHYINPSVAGYPSWTKNCDPIKKIKNHQFYRSK